MGEKPVGRIGLSLERMGSQVATQDFLTEAMIENGNWIIRIIIVNMLSMDREDGLDGVRDYCEIGVPVAKRDPNKYPRRNSKSVQQLWAKNYDSRTGEPKRTFRKWLGK